jgi:branched-subunit amino acid aminotransferase/4-amino-4-deoxychorismate lyase
VFQGHPRHLEAHLLRLAAGASALGQPVKWLAGLQAEITTWLASATPKEDATLRLILHPGPGLLTGWLEPLPSAPQPYRLIPMSHPLDGRREDPAVIHKGLSGPWGSSVLAAARQLGAEDALLIWPDGTLAETAIASVGVESAGILSLPGPRGRVASLAERLDLPGWARSRGLRVETAELSLTHAREGRLWCMNALRGIWPAALL